jgi:predicted double-glycine peptidase
MALVTASHAQPVRTLAEMRRDKVVLQKFDISCGAAALATVLQYQHGDVVTEREVALGFIAREEYLAQPEIVRIRQGFSLLDMRRFVERRGYRGVGLSHVSYQSLVAMAPAIVPLHLHGYNHFVVFRGARANTVLLADPAFGNRTMSVDQFLGAWVEYATLGRLAFIVQRRDGLIPPNQLSVSPADFMVLH